MDELGVETITDPGDLINDSFGIGPSLEQKVVALDQLCADDAQPQPPPEPQPAPDAQNQPAAPAPAHRNHVIYARRQECVAVDCGPLHKRLQENARLTAFHPAILEAKRRYASLLEELRFVRDHPGRIAAAREILCTAKSLEELERGQRLLAEVGGEGAKLAAKRALALCAQEKLELARAIQPALEAAGAVINDIEKEITAAETKFFASWGMPRYETPLIGVIAGMREQLAHCLGLVKDDGPAFSMAVGVNDFRVVTDWLGVK